MAARTQRGLAAAGEMIPVFKDDAETGIENGEIQALFTQRWPTTSVGRP